MVDSIVEDVEDTMFLSCYEWIEQKTTNDAQENNGKSAAANLRG